MWNNIYILCLLHCCLHVSIQSTTENYLCTLDTCAGSRASNKHYFFFQHLLTRTNRLTVCRLSTVSDVIFCVQHWHINQSIIPSHVFMQAKHSMNESRTKWIEFVLFFFRCVKMWHNDDLTMDYAIMEFEYDCTILLHNMIIRDLRQRKYCLTFCADAWLLMDKK